MAMGESLFPWAEMSPRRNFRTDARKQLYKVAVSTVEFRRKREENIVQIRKSKREETLLRKRREVVVSTHNTQPSTGYDQTICLDENLQTFLATVMALASNDIQTKEAAVIHLRKMLSIENNPPIDAVIHFGAVPLLVDILRRSDMPQLQFEGARALTNIVSGTSEHTKVVIDHGALPIFVELLTSGNANIREQALWALGNIAGDSPACRDLALGHGALKQVLSQFNNSAKIPMIRIATWTLSNFCCLRPDPQFDEVKYALPTLQRLLHKRDAEVLADACWSLSYLSEGPNFKIQAVIDAGICPKLVKLLSHSSPFVVIPALRTVGNIVTGDDVQTQVVIDNQALPRILHLLTAQQTKKAIVIEACWTISNITAGTEEQIQAVINAKLFPPLLSLMLNAEFKIKKEAAWAVVSATSGGTDEQIKYLAIQGCIKPLCDMLASPDPTIITACLQGLENILRVGEAEKNAGLTEDNVYVSQIVDAGGLDKIEDLQFHTNRELYEKAFEIIENYLADEYEADEADVIEISDTRQTASLF